MNSVAPVQAAPDDLKSAAASWLISIAVHTILLVVFAFISWVVFRPSAPDVAFNLAPPTAGIGPVGTPGGGSPRPAAGRESPTQQSTPIPSATSSVLENPMEMLLPKAPSAAAPASGDPARMLLQSLASETSRSDAVGGRGLGGVGKGSGEGFGDYISGLGARGLDVVLVLDATDSMEPFIDAARERLHAIMDVVNGLVPGTRFGVVAYKDYGDDYGLRAVKSFALTDDAVAVRQFINQIVAGGGGDVPEPIHEALQAACDKKLMDWGARRKQVIILVGDSPIHSTGRQAAYDMAVEFARRGGTLNVIDVGGADHIRAQREMVQADLQIIAQKGKGSAFLLQDAKAFWRHLITSVFDERYKADIETIIERYVRQDR